MESCVPGSERSKRVESPQLRREQLREIRCRLYTSMCTGGCTIPCTRLGPIALGKHPTKVLMQKVSLFKSPYRMQCVERNNKVCEMTQGLECRITVLDHLSETAQQSPRGTAGRRTGQPSCGDLSQIVRSPLQCVPWSSLLVSSLAGWYYSCSIRRMLTLNLTLSLQMSWGRIGLKPDS